MMDNRKSNRDKILKSLAVFFAVLVGLFVFFALLAFGETNISALETSSYALGDACLHEYDGATCIKCGYRCSHPKFDSKEAICIICGTECPHSVYDEFGECVACGYPCNHTYGFTFVTISQNEHIKKCSRCLYSFGVFYHDYNSSVCSYCNYKCTSHSFDLDGSCLYCDYQCSHPSFNSRDGRCVVCFALCSHQFVNGVCTSCGYNCPHDEYVDGSCKYCGYNCPHGVYDDNYCCYYCGTECPHIDSHFVTLSDSTHGLLCDNCRNSVLVAYHQFVNGVCSDCGYGCNHVYSDNGLCASCGATCPHSYSVSSDYSIVCDNCGFIKHSQIYGFSQVNYLTSATAFKRYGNDTKLTTSLVPSFDALDFNIYVSSSADSIRASLYAPSFYGTLDRYIFIKYRMVDESPSFITLKLTVDKHVYNVAGVNHGTTFGDWVVLMLDLKNVVTSHTFGNSYSIKLDIQHNGALELAYIAMDDNLSHLCDLLDDKEKFYECYNDKYYPLFMSTSAYRKTYDKEQNLVCSHNWIDGKCTECNTSCSHSYDLNSLCTICYQACPHLNQTYQYIDGGDTHSVFCTDCNSPIGSDSHVYGETITCELCGYTCTHVVYKDGRCTSCGFICRHSFAIGRCTSCGMSCHHVFVNDICTVCGVQYQVPSFDIEDGFLNLFTSIYDAQANTFYSMLGYDILGVNIATLIISLVGLAIVLFVLKKVL